MYGALRLPPLHDFISPMVNFKLPFSDNYIATTCTLQSCLYCVLILLQGLAAFHECVWLCKERRIKSQWAYECSSPEELNNRVTVKTSVQRVLQFHHNFCRSYTRVYWQLPLFYFSDKNDPLNLCGLRTSIFQ